MRVLSVALACLALASSAASSAGRPPCNSTPAVSVIGSGSGGAFGVPQLGGLGLPDIGTPGSFSFRVTGAVPHAPGLLILARSEQPLFSPLYQTTLYTGLFGVMVPFQCDANGDAWIAPAPISQPVAGLCGLDLIAQATIFDFTATGGGAWTNALGFRFGSLP